MANVRNSLAASLAARRGAAPPTDVDALVAQSQGQLGVVPPGTGPVARQALDPYSQQGYEENPQENLAAYLAMAGQGVAEDVVPPAGGSAGGGGSTESKPYLNLSDIGGTEDIDADLMGLRGQRTKLDQFKQKIQQWRKSKSGMNIKPFLQWVDVETGSNFAQGHEDPLTQDEKEAVALKYEQNVELQKSNLTSLEAKLKSYKRKRETDLAKAKIGARKTKYAADVRAKSRKESTTDKDQSAKNIRIDTASTKNAEPLVYANADLFEKFMARDHPDVEKDSLEYIEIQEGLAKNLLKDQYKFDEDAVSSLKTILGE